MASLHVSISPLFQRPSIGKPVAKEPKSTLTNLKLGSLKGIITLVVIDGLQHEYIYYPKEMSIHIVKRYLRTYVYILLHLKIRFFFIYIFLLQKSFRNVHGTVDAVWYHDVNLMPGIVLGCGLEAAQGHQGEGGGIWIGADEEDAGECKNAILIRN